MTWVAAGATVISGGIKAFTGYQQMRKGRQMEEGLEKPTFEIPEEVLQNQRIAEQMAVQGLPEAQRQAYLDDQQRSLQAAMRSSSDRRGGLGIISQIQSTQERSNRELLQMDVDARRENMMFAMKNREIVAGYKDKRFEHDFNQYTADLDYARAIRGAGMQNVSSGIDTAIGGIGQGIVGQMNINTNNQISDTEMRKAFQEYKRVGGTQDFKTFKKNKGFDYNNPFQPE